MVPDAALTSAFSPGSACQVPRFASEDLGARGQLIISVEPGPVLHDPRFSIISPSDVELRFSQHGVAVASFTIASSRRVRDQATGEWSDGDTLFLRCSVF